jgi:hypothetical protein
MSLPQHSQRIPWDLQTPDDDYRRSSRYVADLMLAGPADPVELAERLAAALISAVERERAIADALRAATRLLQEQDATIDHQRDTIARLRARLREPARAAA